MLSLIAAVTLAPAPMPTWRWFYSQTNLAVKANVDNLVSVMERAAKVGYNGVVLTDSKFGFLDRMGPEYFRNAERVRDRAKALGIEIIPVVAEVGWAGGLLSHDVNLVEGQTARRVPFEVKNGTLQPVREVALKNGGMEDGTGHAMAGYTFQDGTGQSSFADTVTVKEGKRSLRFENFRAGNDAGNGRIMQTVKVRPHTPYRAQVWIKTEGFDQAAAVRCFGLTSQGKLLSSMDLGVQPTQDWKQHTVIINSQNNTEFNLYLGTWGGNKGKIWFDGLTFEEAGFLNVLRRPGTMPTVETASGTKLVEGTDIARVADPELGQKPWEGEYTFDHTPPTIAVLGNRLRNGDRVFATYTHAAATDIGKTAICPSEPKTMEILRDQFMRVSALFRPKGLFLAHDEIRLANQCPACNKRNLTPGAIYAEDLRRCTNLSRQAVPGGTTYVWSDMFDPYHNAVDDYYLANGTWKEAWKGVSPQLVIVNWNYDKRQESLRFFAGLGCRQIIAGYYDGPVDSIKTWWEAAKGVRGVDGVMYTTWVGDYSKLEEFARVAFRRP